MLNIIRYNITKDASNDMSVRHNISY